jgi:hypothetical protein
MASVLLNQESGSDQLYAGGLLLGSRGLVTNGPILAIGNVGDGSSFTGSVAVVAAAPVSAGPNAPSYRLYCPDRAGGGLNAGSLQVFGYFDATFATPAIQEFIECKPTSIGGTAAALATVSAVQMNQCVPFNYVAPFVGTTTGTGAPLVVACAGIPAGSQIRFRLLGTTAVTYAPIAAPSAVSVQGNVSFTYTGTTGAIYGYEVLFA